ncbi:MAG: hypothetical protein JO040_00675, partial [Gemmatimonadetes bacterium]|nr:hypothetical protein [Gemmatimonadota bacterium]
MDRALFLSHASAISDQLRAHSVETPGGGITWHAPPAPGQQPPRTNLGPHLYEGVLGVALFLAALDHVRERTEHRELVLRTITPLRLTLRELVRDHDRAARLRLQVGGFVGLGAFLYSFLRIGRWLGEPALIEEAHDLTVLLTRERIGSDDRLDLVDGCAGTVLALLALDQAAPGPNAGGATPLELASACAGHLLDRRISYDGRPRAWAAPGKPPLSGFAHGATGIGYALLRLFARTGNEALRDAALEGFAFERSLFDRGAGNWLDLRYGHLLEQSAWCHGAPGAALGRLGVLDVCGADTEIHEELAGFLRSTRSMPDAPL